MRSDLPLRLWLAACAALYATLGLWALSDPVGMAAEVHVQLTDATARSEWRAMYGGFEAAAAVLHARWFAIPELRRMGVGMGTLLLAGLALGRVFGIALEGEASPTLLGLWGAELAGIVSGTSLLWWTSDRPR